MTPAAGCPFDPFRHPGMYDALARARAETPVFYSPAIDAWVVTRYEDAMTVFRDPRRFSARVALQPVAVSPAVVGPVLKAGRYHPPPTNADLDPPEHGRIRRIVMPLMGARRLERLAPTVERIVTEALDRLPGAGRVDLVAELTYELPVRVLFALLGLPDADLHRVKNWARHFIGFVFGRPGAAEQVAAAEGLVAWRDYCRSVVAGRTEAPGDDLISDLVRAHQADPAALTLAEVESYVQGLLVAGHETTTHQAGNSLRLLLAEPARWRALAEAPGGAAAAVEECLRLESSVVAWRRQATEAVTIGGTTIPAGATVVIGLAAANRDPEAFPEPDRYWPDRPHGRANVSFGHGIHFCVGAQLARLELTTLLAAMPRRFPAMRLVDQEYSYPETLSFRGPQNLWVEVG